MIGMLELFFSSASLAITLLPRCLLPLLLKLPLHNVNTKALDGFICSEYIHVYNYTYNFTLEDLASYPLTVDSVLDDYLAKERADGPLSLPQ
jgi:hypothetical protein